MFFNRTTLLHLSHRFNERRALNVAECAPKFNDTDIRLLNRIADGNSRNTFHPILNCVSDMWYNLDGLSEEIALMLALNYVLLDLPRCDIILASEGDIRAPLS